jgi:hypothetical protein
MSTDTEELEVTIDESLPDVLVEGEAQAESTSPEPEALKPDDAIKALKAQLTEAQSAKLDADRRAREAAEAATAATAEKYDSNLHLITNAIGTLSQKQENLKSLYKEALANSDFQAATNFNDELLDTKLRLSQLEAGKQELEKTPPPVFEQPQIADPVERVASRLSPRSADWLRNHPEYATDPKLFNKMVAAHNVVVSSDIAPDTDEYFSEVESILKINRTATHETGTFSDAAQPVKTRSGPVAAPVSRGAAPGAPSSTRITLTREQAEMAEMMGMTPQEYAKNMQLLKREGKMH